MPGITMHFLLADRVLDAWRAHPREAPFDVHDPDHLNAFGHGSVGPDLGYFPGGAGWLSDLAHCLRTGELARALIHAADSPVERAFAWGWVTHVLADQAIHPWIGLGVGELVHGDRDRFVDGSSDLLSHLRVEMGLDAWHAVRHPAVRRRRLRVAFGRDEVGFLVRAYARTYDVPFEEEPFVRSHRATSRRVGQGLATLRLVHALMEGDGSTSPLPGVSRLLGALHRVGALRGVTLAYLTPVRPARWLLDAVDREMDAHAGRFREAFRSGGWSLEDRNLDTGRLLAGERGHPGTRRAREAVASRRAGATRPGTPGRGAPGPALGDPAPVPSEA